VQGSNGEVRRDNKKGYNNLTASIIPTEYQKVLKFQTLLVEEENNSKIQKENTEEKKVIAILFNSINNGLHPTFYIKVVHLSCE
jgi:hypothetical protein